MTPPTPTSRDVMHRMLSLQITTLQDVDGDGDGHVLVANDETGSAQLVEVARDVTRRLTDFGEPVQGRYLPGTRQVVLSVDPGGTERTQLWILDAESDDLSARPLVQDEDAIHTLLDVAVDTVVYATNRRNGVDFDIVAHTVSTGQDQVLYDGGGSFESVALSPKRDRIVASRMTLLPASTQLLLIDVSTRDVTPITNPAIPGDWWRLAWVGDGHIVASTDSGSERFQLRRYDVAAGAWTTVLADDQFDLMAVPDPTGRRLAVIRSRDGFDELFVAPHADGEVGELAPVPLPAQGVVTQATPLRWASAGHVFGFTFSSPGDPPEPYTWSPDEGLRRRTTSNDVAELPGLAPPVLEYATAIDGERVPVFVLRSPAPTGSVVVYIHGGPEAATVRSWNPVAAALALEGHTVVMPNVRGSAGYGRRWVSMDDVDKRLDSVRDLEAVHAWLPALGVDPARAALMGGSYGGYMVLAGLTFQPDLWAAGVDIVGMSSLVTFLENTSAYRRPYREREYGTLESHRDILTAASPLTVIDRLRVPLLVIHGRNDPRVPLSEAEQVVAAVRSNGAECALLVYDDEGHGLAKRANRLDAYPQIATFLSRVLAVT